MRSTQHHDSQHVVMTRQSLLWDVRRTHSCRGSYCQPSHSRAEDGVWVVAPFRSERGARLRFGTRTGAGRWVIDLAGGGRGAWPGRATRPGCHLRELRNGVVHRWPGGSRTRGCVGLAPADCRGTPGRGNAGRGPALGPGPKRKDPCRGVCGLGRAVARCRCPRWSASGGRARSSVGRGRRPAGDGAGAGASRCRASAAAD
jgi:hypothetical protein